MPTHGCHVFPQIPLAPVSRCGEQTSAKSLYLLYLLARQINLARHDEESKFQAVPECMCSCSKSDNSSLMLSRDASVWSS